MPRPCHYTPNVLWLARNAARVRGETAEHIPPCPLTDAEREALAPPPPAVRMPPAGYALAAH